MTELSEKILKEYQVRKTNKQKLAFIKLLKTSFNDLEVQEGGFPKSRNLILGDIDSAKVVLTAHYDTCAWLPFPNLITPKNLLVYMLYSIAIAVPILALGLGFNILLSLIVNDLILNHVFSLVFYILLIYMMLAGPANKHTANDNTSGVITLCEIYQAMTPEQQAETAIVFFDNEELGLIGSSYFRSKYKTEMQNKLLINYDCVSDGDHIMIGVSKKAWKPYYEKIASCFKSTESKNMIIEKAEKLVYPSDQSNFKCTVAVAALNKKRFVGYYMGRIHTGRDTVFDQNNITLLKNSTIRFIEKL